MPDLKDLSLYHKAYCPFCRKVREAMKTMNLDIALVDVDDDRSAYQMLVQEGGRSMVPCLRIDHGNGKVEWMYESDDIIHYLRKNFAS
ncbi:glutathione S-transferase N-terminal domain-containing protein [Shewanella submarina]|uniref:Glutaredoxin family protein n=1 Tax=Shewanella submarina TaxID=2016376 RepID=A0ABV7G5M0_9GAMM|nr:glutathione S-transferase N-terminal domain-containing protein [Shewanella submarina]MCL1038521.1 glutathione S-transferase N-terminal domain-containing protein [Shewanella submarina]